MSRRGFLTKGRVWALGGAALGASAAASAGPAGAPPDYGFQWATIGAPGNRAYEGGGFFGNTLQGRGSVGYEYRVSKLEVTTGQYLEYINAIAPLTALPILFGSPTAWGATDDLSMPAGHYRLRTDVPNASMLPVIGLNWRDAAMFVNWLHNGKQASLAAITDGAYTLTSFPAVTWGFFIERAQRNPGARYWIPSLDEWLKAVHFDPTAEDPAHPGTGRWWRGPYGSDEPLAPGLPGDGNTSAGVDLLALPGGGYFDWTTLPLGAYAGVTTPWGLLDASGGSREWTDSLFGDENQYLEGSRAGNGIDDLALDLVDRFNAHDAASRTGGLRVASRVPSPSAASLLTIGVWIHTQRRRRR